MTNRVIATSICIDPTYRTSVNLGNKVADHSVQELYCALSLVSLYSAKIKNPDDNVCLITNFLFDEEWQQQLSRFEIQHHYVPWTSFIMPASQKWALAYYKLNALEYLLTIADTIVLMDCDTISIDCFNDLWEDAQEWLLLYSVEHRIEHVARRQIIENYANIFLTHKAIEHIGGEFIAGSQAVLQQFICECKNIHTILCANLETYVDMGDEQVLSIAADRLHDKVITANKYIERMWTGPNFRKISTRFKYDKLAILHLPSEKKNGLRTIYAYLRAFGHLPPEDWLISMIGLHYFLPSKLQHRVRWAMNRLRQLFYEGLYVFQQRHRKKCSGGTI